MSAARTLPSMADLPVSEPMIIASHRGPYEACFDENAIDLMNGLAGSGFHFLIDRRIAELYRSEIAPVLASPSVLLIDAVEEAKSLDRFPAYVSHLVERSVRRDQGLVAVGGGIVQDITCFLAATLLRGMEWRFFPTTLLAQADSCIGSKSSINCGAAKNILGTFTPPARVVISTRFLDSLDEKDVRSGIGEILKVHAIAGPGHFDQAAADYTAMISSRATLIAYIRRALEVKKKYIEEDEFDRGPRNVFNYGHSFGHAIEAATNFAIPHGIAVTIGMDMANFVASRLGVSDHATYRHMHPVLARNYRGYEIEPVPVDRFLAAISKDKKNSGAKSLTLILPDRDRRIAKGTYANDEAFAAVCSHYLANERTT